MITTAPQHPVQQHEHEGFYYISSNGSFFKGCRRCGGTGHYSFNGYDSICYLCNNDPSARLGEPFADEAAAQKWCHRRAQSQARRNAKAHAEAAAKVAKMEAKQAALKAANPDIYEFLMGIELGDDFYKYETEDEFEEAKRQGLIRTPERNSFLRSMAEVLRYPAQCDKVFTPNMMREINRAMGWQQAKAAEAAAHPAPTGATVITGEVVGTKVVEGDYGTAFKVTVKDDQGFRVYVSLAKALVDEAAGTADWDPEYPWFHATKGRRLTFTATLEPSSDDASFAFGSRPRKAAWL